MLATLIERSVLEFLIRAHRLQSALTNVVSKPSFTCDFQAHSRRFAPRISTCKCRMSLPMRFVAATSTGVFLPLYSRSFVKPEGIRTFSEFVIA